MCLYLLTSADFWLAVKANTLGGSGVVRAPLAPSTQFLQRSLFWLVENVPKEVKNRFQFSMSLIMDDTYVFLENPQTSGWSRRLNLTSINTHCCIRVSLRFIPYRCTSIRKFVLQVGQIYLNACPGFPSLISVCVEQMAKAWWEGLVVLSRSTQWRCPWSVSSGGGGARGGLWMGLLAPLWNKHSR